MAERSPRRRWLMVCVVTAVVVAAVCWFLGADDYRALSQVAEEAEGAEEALALADDGAPSVPYDGTWLRVEGTSIDLPVMQATPEDPEYWLKRALDGTYSWMGTPFVDFRTTASSPHVLIYGHHLGWTGGMFTDIYDCWRQESFDDLGEAVLLHEGSATRWRPVLALRVDKGYELIQEFGQVDVPGLLSALGQEASARTDSWEAKARASERMLTLVTCASERSGQPWRTLVVFGSV